MKAFTISISGMNSQEITNILNWRCCICRRIENGRYSATVETLCRLSNALDVGLDSLLYDLFPKNTHIQNHDIQKVVSIMETMYEKHAKNVADIVYIYDRGHKS